MICVQFIFKPGTYDDDFHRLDAQIDAYARSLPGYDHVETWHSKEGGLVSVYMDIRDQKIVDQLIEKAKVTETTAPAKWKNGVQPTSE